MASLTPALVMAIGAVVAATIVIAAGSVLGYHGLARPVFDLLLRYAVSEDGRLHSEKYYRTVCEEFSTTRPTFRWRQLVALSRVTASMYGYSQQDTKAGRAPGYEEARKLLKVA